MSSDLTDDEFTLLMLAERGESLMPIGRWEKSVDSLVARGLLHRHDKFNNVITEKGKEAVRLRDAQDDHALLTVMNKAAIASKQPPKMDAPIFMVFRSPCLMEDEGRHFYIKTYDTEEAAKKWIIAQKGEYFDPGAYYVIRGFAVK